MSESRSNDMHLSGELISTDADLAKYPSPNTKIKDQINDKSQLTLGDLHGNALKFLYTLIELNVMQLDEGAYNNFYKIYQKPDHSLEDVKAITDIVNQATVINSPMIRLLGDELADRGKNDYFTLKILEKLPKTTIIFSDHSYEFLRAYYRSKLIPKEGEGALKGTYGYKTDLGQSALSLYNMGQLIGEHNELRSEIVDIVEKKYLPNLKIIDYSFDPQTKKMTLYSHGPIGLATIRRMARKCGIIGELNLNNVEEIKNTIDKINQFFVKSLTEISNETDSEKRLKKFDELIGLELFKENKNKKSAANTKKIEIEHAPMSFPIVRAIWNRDYLEVEHPNHLPQNLNGWSLNIVHGHTGEGKVPEHLKNRVVNLDTRFGKPDHFTGQNTYLYSEHSFELTLEQKQEAQKTSSWQPVKSRSEINLRRKTPGFVIGNSRNILTTLENSFTPEKQEKLINGQRKSQSDVSQSRKQIIGGHRKETEEINKVAIEKTNVSQSASNTRKSSAITTTGAGKSVKELIHQWKNIDAHQFKKVNTNDRKFIEPKESKINIRKK